MKTALFQPTNLNDRKQRVRLLVPSLFGIAVIFCVGQFALPALRPSTERATTRFHAGAGIPTAAAPARQGLHFGAMSSQFDRSQYLYLRIGSNVWFLEARA